MPLFNFGANVWSCLKNRPLFGCVRLSQHLNNKNNPDLKNKRSPCVKRCLLFKFRIVAGQLLVYSYILYFTLLRFSYRVCKYWQKNNKHNVKLQSTAPGTKHKWATDYPQQSVFSICLLFSTLADKNAFVLEQFHWYPFQRRVPFFKKCKKCLKNHWKLTFFTAAVSIGIAQVLH